MTARAGEFSLVSLAKRWVPAPVRGWLRPLRRLRLWYYDRYFRGGVIRRDGFRYRIHERDLIGRALYAGHHPSADEVRLLHMASRHFGSFIDVGANIGTVTVPMAASFAGPVLAVEPVLRNFAMLSDNVRMNGLSDRVRTRRAALGRTRGIVTMHLSADNSGDHRAWSGSDDAGRPVEQVELCTLEDCLEDDRRLVPPFLVKMDVQGFEAEVIAGARSLLQTNPCLVLLEFWPLGLRANGCSPRDLFDLLDGCGMHVYAMAHPLGLRAIAGAEALEQVAAALAADGYLDLVATNRSLDDIGLAHLERNS